MGRGREGEGDGGKDGGKALLAVVHFKENVVVAAEPLLAEQQKGNQTAQQRSLPSRRILAASTGSSCRRKSKEPTERREMTKDVQPSGAESHRQSLDVSTIYFVCLFPLNGVKL